MSIDIAALLKQVRPIVESRGEECGYGFARPDDPNDFHPDAESCTEQEIAAHKAACEAYGKPDYVPPLGSEWIGDGDTRLHILRAPWGIGSYTFRDPAIVNLLAQIDAALADLSAKAAP